MKGDIKLVIRNSDFHDKIHEFKDVLSSTKVKHKNWKNKKDTIISLLTSKLDNINEILNDQHFEYDVKENDDIIIEMNFRYLQVKLKFNQLFNGKIKVSLIYPEIKDDKNEVKVECISLYKEPATIGEVEINKDLHTSFNNMKHMF